MTDKIFGFSVVFSDDLPDIGKVIFGPPLLQIEAARSFSDCYLCGGNSNRICPCHQGSEADSIPECRCPRSFAVLNLNPLSLLPDD